jgi:hypothetical protein
MKKIKPESYWYRCGKTYFRVSVKSDGLAPFVGRMYIVNRPQKKPVRCSICGDELAVNGELFFWCSPEKYCLRCVDYEDLNPAELSEWQQYLARVYRRVNDEDEQ